MSSCRARCQPRQRRDQASSAPARETTTVCRVIGVELATSRDYLLDYALTDEDLGQVIKEVQRLTTQSLQLLHLHQETHAKRREPATEQAS